MNSLESIQILSRSYAVRYRECCANETLVWQFKPIKKSINWAIWRKTDTNATTARPSTATARRRPRRRRSTVDGEEAALEERKFNLHEKLKSVGMEEVVPGGRCEGGQIQKGTYNVTKGGMYALVFDNTFSKNTSKTVFFILSNHPVALPAILRDSSTDLSNITDSSLATTFSGILYKKRRKKLQGYAKRYFTLSATSGELSYSQSSHNPLLRGTIPLALAALNIDYGRREFIIDSGADIWHLKASNESEFDIWKTRLEDVWLKAVAGRKKLLQDQEDGHEISSEWRQVEGLVDRLEMMKDFVKGMVQDANQETSRSREHSGQHLSIKKSIDNLKDVSAKQKEGKGGMKIFRKKEKPTPPLSLSRELSNNSIKLSSHDDFLDHTITPKLGSLEQNLESILASFHSVLSTLRVKSATSMTQGIPSRRASMQSSRHSMDSAPDDWFDAQSISGHPEEGLITVVEQGSDSEERADESTEDEDDLAALREGAVSPLLTRAPSIQRSQKVLYPLSEWRGRIVKRRTTLPTKITIPPPSLLAFLRKNVHPLASASNSKVGKDFSTIAMPVTSNEPTTLLQRLPEDLEYTHLLDSASTTPVPHQKMLYLAVFAQSFLSTLRSPKRALRKSFTPLLGETYELVREDKGWRFLAEKVLHRPQVFAAHAESELWQWSFCPSPRQKFWGKSFEMTIDGTVRVVLRTGEVITWQKPACYMRNIIAGEKYVEPVGEIIVWNHTTGEKAVVEFKPAKGIWGGRAEEMAITTYTKDGDVGLRAEGKWTESVSSLPTGEVLWRVGELVDQEDKYCGFPLFTAQLSEMTSIEEGFIPPTDSRLRPDRMLHEAGKMNDAEEVKVRLEEEQRARRREGIEPSVRWFQKVTLESEGLERPSTANSPRNGGHDRGGIGSDSDETGEEQVWRIKEGKNGYWSRREQGNWDGGVTLW